MPDKNMTLSEKIILAHAGHVYEIKHNVVTVAFEDSLDLILCLNALVGYAYPIVEIKFEEGADEDVAKACFLRFDRNVEIV